MKRLLLVCFLLTASYAVTFAFSPITTTPVTKGNFTANVAQLNTLIGQNKIDLARTKWNEVHDMMKAEFAILKEKYHSAVETGNNTEIERYTTLLQQQQKTYLDIMHLKENLVANKVELNAKLTQFGNNIQ